VKAFKFKPIEELGIEIPRNARREALEAAAEYIRTAMLDYIGEGKSPVQGFGKFPGYTKNYKTLKGESSSASTVNLELSGEMLDALDARVSGSTISINVFGGGKIAGKAEGNNLGTYGQSDPIPGKARRFIPLENEKLKKDILQGVKDILKEYETDGES
jgi:hypothetical protein